MAAKVPRGHKPQRLATRPVRGQQTQEAASPHSQGRLTASIYVKRTVRPSIIPDRFESLPKKVWSAKKNPNFSLKREETGFEDVPLCLLCMYRSVRDSNFISLGFLLERVANNTFIYFSL